MYIKTSAMGTNKAVFRSKRQKEQGSIDIETGPWKI